MIVMGDKFITLKKFVINDRLSFILFITSLEVRTVVISIPR